MDRRYRGEPVPSIRSTPGDDLAHVPATGSTTTTGRGTRNVPDAGSARPDLGSLQYHRPPLGVALTIAPQDVGIGVEVGQSGAGRAFVRPTLGLGVQSPTPEPDRRRIARPMPTGSRDDIEVIR